MIFQLLIFFFLTIVDIQGADEIEDFGFLPKWSYEEPWPMEIFPKCHLPMQSPINLESNRALPNDCLEMKFRWNVEDNPEALFLINKQNIVELTSDDFRETTVIGQTEYKVAYLNFHWGRNASQGSEHKIEGKSYSGEIEIVHIRYDMDLLSAIRSNYGFFILSVLLEEDEEVKKDAKELQEFQTALARLQQTNYVEFRPEGKKVSWEGLIPTNKDKFFKYTGSMSTPPCLGNVDRVVFHDTLKVTPGFFAALRTLKHPNGNRMEDTYRAVMPLDNRIIHKSFPDPKVRSPEMKEPR